MERYFEAITDRLCDKTAEELITEKLPHKMAGQLKDEKQATSEMEWLQKSDSETRKLKKH